MSFTEAEIETLELLVKAGRIPPQAPWREVIPEASKYVVDLAARLLKERQPQTSEAKVQRPTRLGQSIEDGCACAAAPAGLESIKEEDL